MATALAQEARDRRSAPEEEEETPDIDVRLRQAEDLKRTDVTSE